MSEKNPNLIWIASFDIGKKNFAFYIEEMDIKELGNIKNISYHSRYNDDGSPTAKMKKILEKVCGNGRAILHLNSDLTEGCRKSYLDPLTFYNMNDLLDKYGDYWDECDFFIIEQQMNFGKRRNSMAVKLGQHCFSYFTFRYGRFKTVIEFPAYHKTCVLGAPKTRGKMYKNGNYKWIAMEKPARKKWAVVKAVEILERRGEKEVIDGIKIKRKKDDLADTLVQLQSFKYLYFVDGKEEFFK